MGLDIQTISILEDVCEPSVHEYIDRYFKYKPVLSRSELCGDSRGRPATITDDDLLIVCALWAEDPTLYVQEVAG